MKKQFLLFILVFGISHLWAQGDFYSYLTDKKFNSPDDLIGYNFTPSQLEIPNEGSQELGPGEYSFGISQNNLYVSGEGIKGLYNVNNINTTEYGFILSLLNARDPRQQGHLKVILVGKGYVDALVFKKSSDDGEIIFLLPEKPQEVKESDKQFYTSINRTEILQTDSIWGTQIYPYFRVYNPGNIHQKMQYSDSTYIDFVEEIQITEKIKSPKKNKPSKAKKKKKNTEEMVESIEDETMELPKTAPLSTVDSLTQDSLPLLEKKIKITKQYFIDLHTMELSEEGVSEYKITRYSVKNWKEREDEAAGAMDDRYQVEFETNKGPIYLYITGRRTFSKLEIGSEQYLMQGY